MIPTLTAGCYMGLLMVVISIVALTIIVNRLGHTMIPTLTAGCYMGLLMVVIGIVALTSALSTGMASGPLVSSDLSLMGMLPLRGRPSMAIDVATGIGRDWITPWPWPSLLAATWDCWWWPAALSTSTTSRPSTSTDLSMVCEFLRRDMPPWVAGIATGIAGVWIMPWSWLFLSVTTWGCWWSTLLAGMASEPLVSS